MRRHALIFAWSPDSSTSGTSMPFNSRGRVYCGYSSSPSENDSSSGDSADPSTPGIEPRHAVCQHHRRQFAAGEDVVADADFLVNAGVQRALVNALVVAAEQHEFLFLRQFAGDGR